MPEVRLQSLVDASHAAAAAAGEDQTGDVVLVSIIRESVESGGYLTLSPSYGAAPSARVSATRGRPSRKNLPWKRRWKSESKPIAIPP